MKVAKKDLLKLYRTMVEIRETEESLVEPILNQTVGCPVHLYSGEEAIAVGISSHLTKQDHVFGNHRSHGHYLAKGGSLKEMIAEIYCREGGCSKGRGGSMHLIAPEVGMFGSAPIVAGTISLALGAALAAKNRKDKSVAVTYFGDGATGEGGLFESLNFASLKNSLCSLYVRIIFIQHTCPLMKSGQTKNIAIVAQSFDIKSYKIEGNDIIEVLNTAKEAIEYMRNGFGPVFIECLTYRQRGHVGPDDNIQGSHTDIRPEEEVKKWFAKDPIQKFESYLERDGRISKGELFAIKTAVKKRIIQFHKCAINSAKPKAGDLKEMSLKTRKLTYALAINEAIHQAMQEDERVMLIGQGVKSPWYVGNTCRDLVETFGEDRVIDTPVSENAMTGAAVGAAIAGSPSIIVHPRMDFMLYAFDPIINEAANWYYMNGGNANVPVVIWGIINRAGEQSAQHSQALQAMFAHVPGLKVVMPATPYDAKGLMAAAIKDPNPVVFVDDRWLYGVEGDVPEESYEVEIGKAFVMKEGKDITIVSNSFLAHESLNAAKELEKDGIFVEVVDLRTVKPLDQDTVLSSVRKTGILLVVDGTWKSYGVSAEISALVAEKGFDFLTGPIYRLALPDVPAGASKTLENAYYIKQQNIINKVKDILH